MSLTPDHVQFAFRVTRAEFQSLTDDQMLGRTALERRFARPAPSVSSDARQASRACVMAGGPPAMGRLGYVCRLRIIFAGLRPVILVLADHLFPQEGTDTELPPCESQEVQRVTGLTRSSPKPIGGRV